MGVSREKLYEEVWAEPMTKVSARYKVSSNFLARVCERLRIPHPLRGYWAKLSFGKSSNRPELPEALPGDELEWTRDGEPRRAAPMPPTKKVVRKARPPSERPNRHPLIIEAETHFASTQLLKGGYLRPAKRLVADVFVSKDTLPRALDVASELFLTLEDRGHRVVIAPNDRRLRRLDVDQRENGGFRYYYGGSWSPGRPTVAFLGTLAFGLTLYELSEHVDVQLNDGKWIRLRPNSSTKNRAPSEHYSSTHKDDLPSGRLCLRAFSPYPGASWQREWRESATVRLPSLFRDVVDELEREAPAIVKLLEESERQAEIDRKESEAQLRELEREIAAGRRAEATRKSREQLLEIVDEWGLARRIEEFFKDANKRTAKLGEKDRAALVDRLKQARTLLGGVDALERFRAWKSPDESQTDDTQN